MSEDAWDRRLGSIILERYQLKSFLARGGMGAVFLCDDLRLPGQIWAIKEMLSSHPMEASLVEQSFRREAEMLAGLRHPSLPVIVDSFAENQRHYVVMEYISGQTLARHIQKSGPARLAQAVDWGLQLARVLQYLHEQNPPVIFRDLKPDNVMVTENDCLKLVDFGLARHFQPGKLRDTQAAGSIGYSPPEQWEDTDQTDERSDIYGLGAILFFVLTGKPPSPVYGQQSVSPLRSDVDERLERVVLKCLQPAPSQRYAQCAALITDLEACQKLSPVPERPPSRPRIVWLGAVLGLICLIVYGLSQTPKAPSKPLEIEQILLQTEAAKSRIRAAMEAGKYDEAIGQLQGLIEEHPQDGESQILMSNARALQAKGPVWRIPVFSSTSGSEYEGIQMLNGLALAQQELNLQGVAWPPGVGRVVRKLVLDYQDCHSRQDLTLQLYLKAAKNSHYALAIGPWSSQQLLAVSPIVESTQFPTLAPTASDPRTTHLGPCSLTVADSDVGRVDALAGYFARQGFRRVVLMRNEESVVGHSSAARFTQIFQSCGGSVTAELGYLQDTRDYQPLIEEIARARPDCLFLPEYRAGVVMTVTRGLRTRGIRIPVGSLAAVYSHSPLQVDPNLDGIVVCSYFYAEAPDPAVEKFTRAYREMTGSATPSHREAYAYDSLYLVAAALEAVGFDRRALRQYFASLGVSRPAFRGVTGEFTPTRRKETRKPYLLEIRGGKFRLLSDQG